MDAFVGIVEAVDTDEIETCLEKFCRDFSAKMKFEELNKDDLRSKVWSGIFRVLNDEGQAKRHCKCLEVLRILSRDKTDLDQLVTDQRLDVIIARAGLSNAHLQLSYDTVIIEALKLLCNLIYNAPLIQLQLPKTECLKNLVKRIKDQNSKSSLKYNAGLLFDTRILFLVTALNSTTRNSLKDDVQIDVELINFLDKLSHEMKTEKNDELREKFVEVTCEVLKAVFNLYIDSDDSTDELKGRHEKLADILYKLLRAGEVSKNDDLHSHIANLLTVLPSNCLAPIAPQANPIKQIVCHHVYDKCDMTAVNQLLLFLDKRLDSQSNLIENLLPVMTALLRLVRTQRVIRKWTRQAVLPSLRGQDVMHRPEEDDKLRGKLCKLLTNPITEVRDLVAEFLFVLCKQNIGRMIKYTGYGNAAGMFANKGLLAGKRAPTDYSDESGESDTEEYAKYKPDINPVTGCYEEPKVSPLEGMTEEQKEYEAIKLVNLVSQLTDNGVIRPCTVGEDGKPQPVQHVLELQEGLKKSQSAYKNDSDSD